MRITLSARYHSGETNFNGLDAYYGADSLGGFAEAVCITTHAILNKEVKTQTPATSGFDLKFKENHRGSYVQKFTLELTDQNAISNFTYLGLNGFIELLTFHMGSPLGLNRPVTGRAARKWLRDDMEDSEALLERLERPLKRIHHPVTGQGYQVTVYRAQTPILEFNEQTYDYLAGGETSERVETLDLSVSRFNIRTGTGRFTTDGDAESISFSPVHGYLSQAAKIRLADSLVSGARGEERPVRVTVRRVLSRDGRTKHLILQGVHEI
ncbi:hypothetical protein GEV39_18245 [Pseudomonas sp. NY5710]|uniref:DUF7947 five-stranded beta-barrel domain-containing protein n=1 Tax=Pseudomonas sp. NY5710 TaxID=2662033 RepID=UPI00156EB3D4|nr:hypothetical protein [Pseudomonas sp. NY5710]KAF4558702.1 hypothetical protein HBJ16_003771 [Pseudomonas sp. CES]QKL03192.1 hypothetical protein GEV39_18245 [Pseudomonas sp. NY5710]